MAKTTDEERLFHRGRGATHNESVDIVDISRSDASLLLRAANKFYRHRTPASLAELDALVSDAQKQEVISSREERPEAKARREAAERRAIARGERVVKTEPEPPQATPEGDAEGEAKRAELMARADRRRAAKSKRTVQGGE